MDQAIWLWITELCSRTVAHPLCNALHLLQELSNESIVDTRLHKQTGPRYTCLPRSDERSKGRPVDG